VLLSGLLALVAAGVACHGQPAPAPKPPPGIDVNDIHSGLNQVRVAELTIPGSIHDVQGIVRRAKAARLPISIAGSRHAMGGQQFGAGTILIDMTGMKDVVRFDRERGLVEAEAGITWPDLLEFLRDHQGDAGPQWGFRQKQTGADRLTLGGALAADAHGHGLAMKPIVSDVESLILVDAEGNIRRCSRSENPDLFRLVIGGYGLFGVIAHVELRLAPRVKVEKRVEAAQVRDLPALCERRIKEGYTYGDFQFSIDPQSDDFLRQGVLSCWRPVKETTPLTEPKRLTEENLAELYYLAHAEPAAATERSAAFTLGTTGEVGWSDEHQMGFTLEGYHQALDARLESKEPGTEMLTELDVPRERLPEFLEDVRALMKERGFGPVYGTIRLVEQDDETFLPYARQRSAAVDISLHVVHSPAGMEQAADRFRRLIDLAHARGGSFSLTYHRFATKQQVEACYPEVRDFLARKKQIDPDERFQSEWYRHVRALFQP